MGKIISAIPSLKPSALTHLQALESLPNNNENATVASLLVNSVAGSTYPLSMVENFSDGAFTPLTSPYDGVDVDDWDALDLDSASYGDT